jgi:hypothetical protein
MQERADCYVTCLELELPSSLLMTAGNERPPQQSLRLIEKDLTKIIWSKCLRRQLQQTCDVLDDNMTTHVILGPFSHNVIVLKCTNKLGRVERNNLVEA